MTTATIANIAQILAEASEAARAASHAEYQRMGRDMIPCAFVKVSVFGVKLNTKIGKAMAAAGFKRNYGQGTGIGLNNPGGLPVQNESIKMAGAAAYADVLHKYGITAWPESRLD